VPDGSCDCRVYAVGEAERVAFAELRGYTPPAAGVDELLASRGALHLSSAI